MLLRNLRPDSWPRDDAMKLLSAPAPAPVPARNENVPPTQAKICRTRDAASSGFVTTADRFLVVTRGKFLRSTVSKFFHAPSNWLQGMEKALRSSSSLTIFPRAFLDDPSHKAAWMSSQRRQITARGGSGSVESISTISWAPASTVVRGKRGLTSLSTRVCAFSCILSENGRGSAFVRKNPQTLDCSPVWSEWKNVVFGKEETWKNKGAWEETHGKTESRKPKQRSDVMRTMLHRVPPTCEMSTAITVDSTPIAIDLVRILYRVCLSTNGPKSDRNSCRYFFSLFWISVIPRCGILFRRQKTVWQ